ncbi:hypothetical protein JOQ06_022962 [Pogonophryne albipinna]|uniref:Uncharacterized protein n=1 Tax=Pogonophryne albipinna TaxID=1090488 RepID=A0AAD6F2W2_9TELE|nr:hypothetical protein JOQ06_022962 [Pogonophryne albipinna]
MSSLLLISWIFLLQISASSSSSPVLHHPESPDVSPDSPDSLLPPSECPSCALARVRRGEEDEGREDVVEAVKRHILNMLHLQQRPNITRPVPRAALINALRKLHVGRVGEDGSVHIEGGEEGGRGGERGGRNRGGDGGGGEEATETTEIITFAEAGTSVIILSDGEGFLAQAKCRPPFSNTKRFCPVFSRLDSCVPVHLQRHTEHN